MAVGAAGEIRDHAWLVTIDIKAIDALESLEGSDVRQPWRAVDIADGVNAGEVRFVTITDLDVATVGFPTE